MVKSKSVYNNPFCRSEIDNLYFVFIRTQRRSFGMVRERFNNFQKLKSKMSQNLQKMDFSKSKRRIDGGNRSCTPALFFIPKVNGEIMRRTWIFYSDSLGTMFCTYCLFFGKKTGGAFTEGFDDWKHPNRITEHENSKNHYEASYTFTKRSAEVENLESQLVQQAIIQKQYWREILKRVLSVICFLSSRLPFRGSNQQMGNCQNGNYLGTLELLAEYDQLLESHIAKYANKGKGHVSYMSSTIVDEFIQLIAREVRAIIAHKIRQSKYFSLIVDSTPDVAHLDQLTIIIRYVEEIGVATERFLTFLENVGHKGSEMEVAVLDFLKNNDVLILDCRGQSYDNAKNMTGKYKGLQTRIRLLNPLAVFIPCGCHSLNLCVEHAAGSTSEVIRFFMFLQNVYVFFSASTKRWQIMLGHLKKDLEIRKENNPQERLLVPKRLSDTRWSAKADATRALVSGYSSFGSALKQIYLDPDEKKVRNSLNYYKKFLFRFGLPGSAGV